MFSYRIPYQPDLEDAEPVLYIQYPSDTGNLRTKHAGNILLTSTIQLSKTRPLNPSIFCREQSSPVYMVVRAESKDLAEQFRP